MVSKISQLLNPNDFSSALWPYRCSSVVFGQCNAVSKTWRAIYAVFLTAVHLALSLTVTYDYTIIVTADGLSNGQVFIAWTNLIVNTIVPPIHIWTWFFVGQTAYGETVSSLTIIDKELLQIPNCRVNFRAMVTRQLVSLFLSMVLYVTIVFSYSYAQMKSNEFDVASGVIWRMFVVWYPSTIRITSCYTFGNMVIFIKERYVVLNRALKDVFSSDNAKAGQYIRGNLITDQVSMIKKLRMIHGKLFFTSRKIMDAFALQVSTCFLASLVCGIVDLYQLYHSQVSPCDLPLNQIFNCVIETVNDFGPIIYVAYNAHKTMQKGNEATQIINSVVIYDEKLNLEVTSFSHQLMHYRLRFSPFGLFELDLTSLQSMIATISLYLIIFIQLQPSSVAEKCTTSKKKKKN